MDLSLQHRYAIGQYVDVSGDVIAHLNISHVRADDGGLYKCVATNSMGSVEHAARLNVYGKFIWHIYVCMYACWCSHLLDNVFVFAISRLLFDMRTMPLNFICNDSVNLFRNVSACQWSCVPIAFRRACVGGECVKSTKCTNCALHFEQYVGIMHHDSWWMV